MSRVLTVLRGLPGSGKSRWVAEMWPSAVPIHHARSRVGHGRLRADQPVVISTDHFWELETGIYVFDIKRLGEAHAWAQCQLVEAMRAGVTVILDNTHSRRWEFALAETLADAFDYAVAYTDLFDGGLTDAELALRNIHGVTKEIIAKMRTRWERLDEFRPPAKEES